MLVSGLLAISDFITPFGVMVSLGELQTRA
jgi:hypothetical protein